MAAGDPDLAVSVITVLELAPGVARANRQEKQNDRQRFLDDLLSGMPVRPVTIPVALRAGQMDGLLQASGLRCRIC